MVKATLKNFLFHYDRDKKCHGQVYIMFHVIVILRLRFKCGKMNALINNIYNSNTAFLVCMSMIQYI